MSGNVGLGTNKGSWNALKNAPAISNSTRNNSAGDYYTTSVAGTSSFTSRGRGQYFAVGDIIVFNGAVWTKNNQFSAESGFGTPANWKAAYDDHIISGSFANNTITLNQKDGGSFTIDLTGVGGSSVLYRNTFEVTNSLGQNSFTLSASIDSEDKTQVFIDGVYQQKTGYSVSGTSLTFDGGVVVPQYSTVEIISFSSVALTESLADAKIFVGDSSANAVARTVSGDATLANTGALTLNTSAKTTLGLNNVNNTTDANKPVSTAQQAEIDTKADIASPTFTGTVGGITKAMVGLANAENTTDLLKPVSTATQNALNLKANLAGPTLTGNTSAANLTLSGYLRGPASFVIDPSAHGDDTGTVVIAGNLQVDGTQTTINSTTVSIDDLNLTLASGASSSSAANGAGITIDGASASMLYTHATTNFIFNKPIHIDSTLLVQADNGGVQNATLELIGRQSSAFGGDSRQAKSSIYSETSGAQYSANLVFKTNNGSNSLTERLRLNFNGDAIFSGDVGIGTTSPNYQLDIENSSHAVLRLHAGTNSSASLRLKNDAIDWDVNCQTNDTFAIYSHTSNTQPFSILPNGNVGIGVSSPTVELEVNGSLLLNMWDSPVNERGIFFRRGFTSSNKYNSSILTYDHNGSGGTPEGISINGYDGVTFCTGSNNRLERMRISLAGNVGIGTASPTTALTIRKAISSSAYGSSASMIEFKSYFPGYDTETVKSAIYSGVSDLGTLNTQGGFLAFHVNNNGTMGEKLRIEKTGNVGIGTDSPSAKLSVSSSDAALNVSNIAATNAGYYSQVLTISCARGATTGYNLIQALNGSTNECFKVAGSGDVSNTNNAYGQLSDIKLKENITDATPKLTDLLKVKIKNFNFIDNDTKQIGVIAQELEEIFPSMISESTDTENREVTDDEGNVTNEVVDLGTTTKSVKYSVFTPMLIKAIQEQQTIIEDLKSRIETLEG